MNAVPSGARSNSNIPSSSAADAKNVKTKADADRVRGAGSPKYESRRYRAWINIDEPLQQLAGALRQIKRTQTSHSPHPRVCISQHLSDLRTNPIFTTPWWSPTPA